MSTDFRSRILSDAEFLSHMLMELTDEQVAEVSLHLYELSDDLERGPVREMIGWFGGLAVLEHSSRVSALNHARAEMADGHLIDTTWDPHPQWGDCWQGDCWCDYRGPQRPTEEQAEQDAVEHLRALGVPDMRDEGGERQ